MTYAIGNATPLDLIESPTIQTEDSTWESLPEEILFKIIQEISFAKATQLLSTSRKFRIIADKFKLDPNLILKLYDPANAAWIGKDVTGLILQEFYCPTSQALASDNFIYVIRPEQKITFPFLLKKQWRQLQPGDKIFPLIKLIGWHHDSSYSAICIIDQSIFQFEMITDGEKIRAKCHENGVRVLEFYKLVGRANIIRQSKGVIELLQEFEKGNWCETIFVNFVIADKYYDIKCECDNECKHKIKRKAKQEKLDSLLLQTTFNSVIQTK